ncbi:Hypothetical protein Tcol_3111 [Trichococcus collinsii]|nr:phage replisome organizer N-terminal domain-containing protein [Trichococcus collinsii]CZR10872.1 Hypothetical protein Tcol_3111 [Trichococcus collinsii]
MAEISWIKLTINMFDDEKIRIIQAMPESDAIIIVWIRLLTLAGKTNDDGRIYIDRDIPYTEEILSTLFNKPLNTIRLAVDTLKRFKMISTDDGVIVIRNWEKHQNIEGMNRLKIQNAERQKRFRDRKKIEQLNLEELEKRDSNVTPTLYITSHHAIDIEEEVEEDKEKDIKDIMSSKSARRIYEDSSPYFQLSQYLFSKMVQNNPEAKKPNYQLWADDIRKMVELDGRTPQQVQGMIDWSQSDEFWKTNILSAKKLREKYDQMKVTANANYKKKPKTEVLPDWAANEPDSKETPVDPEEQRKLNERIAKLKTSGKESTG